ncbi:hypothetical protein Tco_0315397, partial [Tanacetum coccineum]
LEGNENVDTDAFIDKVLNIQEDTGTKIEPESYKERSMVEKTINVLIINDDEEEKESAKEALIWRKSEKGTRIEETRNTPPPTPIRSPRIQLLLYLLIRRYSKN